MKHLYNQLGYYYYGKDKKWILDYIDDIDLDEFVFKSYQDRETTEQILWIKESGFIRMASAQIDEELQKIRTSYRLSQNPQNSLPNLYANLSYIYYYVRQNQIFYEIYQEYEELVTKSIDGLLACYKVQKCSFKNRFLRGSPIYTFKFDDLLLDLMVHNVRTQDLKELFKRYDINELEIATNDFPSRVLNLLKSTSKVSQFIYRAKKKDNYFFSSRYGQLFANTFFLLSKIKVRLEENWLSELPNLVIQFLRKEKNLPHFTLTSLNSLFLHKEISACFTAKELLSILNILLNKEFSRHSLFSSVIHALSQNHPNHKIKSKAFIQKVIDKHQRHEKSNLLDYWRVCSKENQLAIKKVVENNLDSQFDFTLYFNAATNFMIDYKKHFPKAIDFIYESIQTWNYEVVCDKAMPCDFTPNWFIQLLYMLNIDTSESRLSKLANAHEYFNWLLNLESYDYAKFKLEWLLIYDVETYTNKFRSIPRLKRTIEKRLKSNYNAKIADIYYEHIA